MNEMSKKDNTESIKEPGINIAGELPENIIAEIKKIPGGKVGLIVIKGPGIGDKFFITKEELLIGRSPESDIFLDDITVSRKHAVLKKEENGYRIIDSGSLNGSYINNNIADEALLKNGDRIQIGKYIFIYFSTI
jgi:pSer/pThr/pTyr-binding forkhead associated (FHA) protein